MNIAVLNWQDRLNPQAGGAEIHLHEVFGRLVRRGHRVTLMASAFPDAPEREEVDGIDVHRAGSRLTFSFAAPAYYRRQLARLDFDVLVEDLNKVPLFAPLWARHPIALLVHHLFGATAFQEASPPVAAAAWLLERPLALVYRGVPAIAVSQSTAQDLERRGLHRDSIEVVPNGVDLTRYTPGMDARFREPTLLYLGRLRKYKRVDLPIRALARLRRHGVGARLVIAGTGPQEADLRRVADRAGVGDAVEFRGYVDEEEKLELFRRAWVNVLTSPKEGWGITNLEAAACGTPTVASDSPGLRDSVLDGKTGLLAPHGDVDALADRLERLIRSPELRSTMGRNARTFAEGFTWDRAAERTESFLADVARKGAGRNLN